jgi:hypothetical protein
MLLQSGASRGPRSTEGAACARRRRLFGSRATSAERLVVWIRPAATLGPPRVRERGPVAPVCRLTCSDLTILSRRTTCCLACVLRLHPMPRCVPAEAPGGREKPAGPEL